MSTRRTRKSPARRVPTKPRLLVLAIAQALAAASHAATIRVNSSADAMIDNGACTLREAVVSANTDSASGQMLGECGAGSGADTVVFDALLSGQTITLTAAGTAGDIDITSAVTIQGPGADQLTLSGNFNSRIFNIDDGDSNVAIAVTLRPDCAPAPFLPARHGAPVCLHGVRGATDNIPRGK